MEPQQQATCESAIQLGDLTINARGGKYVPLRRNGGPPVWQSAEWQKIIWHPAAFNDPTAKRVCLCLEPDEASTAQLQEIEQHLVRALTALSLSEPKVFGKFLTETDVKDRFQSCLKTSPHGGSYLKLKLDWGRVRIWGPNQEELAEPGDLGASCARCGTTQSVFTAFRYLGGTAASASRMRETATYSEAITKSCTGRQLRLDSSWVT